jgi:hypothetical protein
METAVSSDKFVMTEKAHGVITQKAVALIFTALETSNLIWYSIIHIPKIL